MNRKPPNDPLCLDDNFDWWKSNADRLCPPGASAKLDAICDEIKTAGVDATVPRVLVLVARLGFSGAVLLGQRIRLGGNFFDIADELGPIELPQGSFAKMNKAGSNN